MMAVFTVHDVACRLIETDEFDLTLIILAHKPKYTGGFSKSFACACMEEEN